MVFNKGENQMVATLKTILDATCGQETKYVPDFSDVETLVKLAKESGYKVILTQGVYDMFHVGHARYLEAARGLGDMLIVGVDSDELTRQMKGEDRPFDQFEERVELLCHLRSVSIVTRRHTDQQMYDLIKLVKPHVLVMSQTTTSFGEEDKRILTEFCGDIQHLTPQAATTTTAKLRRLRTDGAKELAREINKVVQEYVGQVVG